MRRFTDEQLTKMREMTIEECKDNRELSLEEKAKIERELEKQKSFIKKYDSKKPTYRGAACFRKMNLSNVDFSGIDLRGASFVGAILINTNFSGANLQGATFNFVNCIGSNFSSSNLEETEFMNANINFSIFDNSNLKESYFNGSFISNSMFRDINAERALFYPVLISQCYFNRANLYRVDFEGSHIFSSDFSDSNIHESYFVLREENDIVIDNNPSICPKEGAFYGYIKVDSKHIIKIEIPEESKRVQNFFRRTCRANKAIVVEIQNLKEDCPVLEELSLYHKHYKYGSTIKVGDIWEHNDFVEKRFQRQTDGVHFFLDRNLAKKRHCWS